MYSVWHNYLLFYYFYYWLLVSAWIGHHQANIYKNLKMLVRVVYLVNFMGSHSHSLFFFIINTSFSCVICSNFLNFYDMSTVHVSPRFLLIDNLILKL